MAVGDAPVMEALIEINAASSGPDRTGRALAHARPASGPRCGRRSGVIIPAARRTSVEAGLTAGDAEDVLVAVAPIVGAPRTASAAVKIMEALDLAIELAQEDAKSAQGA